MQLYDTLLRSTKPIHAHNNKYFGFYCCGPTVYGAAHIGNFRTFVLQDVFRRCVELNGIRTKHVRNITDVDDKTIRGAVQSGQSLSDFTRVWTERFHADCAALNCLPPHVEPSAVAHIPQQIAMIESLMAKGHAYAANDGSVYFSIPSFSEYGKLSHLDQRELELGKTAKQRNGSDEYAKDSVADFVLWKARKPEDGENFWPSPWGEGRPGWHLECSAMIKQYLGDSFDLHSGGVDLVFPHHENEIAQSRCSCGGDFARHWFHITHLLVDGGKMSKSLGNLYTLEDLQARGHTAMELRYVLVAGYYRRPLNFTLDSLSDAKTTLQRLARFSERLQQQAGHALPSYKQLSAKIPAPAAFEAAWQSLNDDLNTPEALGHVFSAIKSIKIDQLDQQQALQNLLGFSLIMHTLGLELPKAEEEQIELPAEVAALAEQRWQAKQAKDFASCDRLRDELAALGYQVKDRRDGYSVGKL